MGNTRKVQGAIAAQSNLKVAMVDVTCKEGYPNFFFTRWPDTEKCLCVCGVITNLYVLC